MSDKVITGMIVFISAKRKFGFIESDAEDSKQIFFSVKGVIEPRFSELKEGMDVQFIQVETPKGPRAIGVVGV